MKKQKPSNTKTIRHCKSNLQKLAKKNSCTDLKRLDTIQDEDIDYSDTSEIDAAMWSKAKIVDRRKKAISLRVDQDVLDWFKGQEGRYQKLMNQVLRQYMNTKN